MVIDKSQLLLNARYAQPYQVEKDYTEELFLSELFGGLDSIVFKGGTALSKFYGSQRFSDDLDFSLLPNMAGCALEEAIDRMITHLSGEYPIKVMRKRNASDVLTYELSMRGPLFESLNKYQHLKIEIDREASVTETVETFRRNPIYSDLKPYLALVMSEREILAEKVVALLFRRNMKARDLYDMYFLLSRGVELKVSLVDRKMKEHGHVFTAERMDRRLHSIGSIWDKELRRLLPEKGFIGYRTAADAVIEGFTKANML